MIGISTTYFGYKGFKIFDSVKRSQGLGFPLSEIGAGHSFEPNAWSTVKKIAKDFPELEFTVHSLFPPPKKEFWFNASEGLTKQNKKVVSDLFETARILEAKLVGLHPGFPGKVGMKEFNNGLKKAFVTKSLPRTQAFRNSFQVIGFALDLALEQGISVCIENLPLRFAPPLFVSKQDFLLAFKEFPKLGLLFDLEHATLNEKIQELLELREKIMEVHLCSSDKSVHGAITGKEDLEPLKAIGQLKEIPLVFEHAAQVSEQELLEEKKLVEEFVQGF